MVQKNGLVQRKRHSAAGNGALLVVIDSSGPYWERVIVDEAVLVALEHFGFPYRLLDLAEQELAKDGCALALLWAESPAFYALPPRAASARVVKYQA